MPSISNQLRQAYEVQDLAFALLTKLREELEKTGVVSPASTEAASAIATATRAWQTAQERISFHRRVPSPGRERPRAPRRRARGHASAGSQYPPPGATSAPYIMNEPLSVTTTPPAASAAPSDAPGASPNVPLAPQMLGTPAPSGVASSPAPLASPNTPSSDAALGAANPAP